MNGFKRAIMGGEINCQSVLLELVDGSLGLENSPLGHGVEVGGEEEAHDGEGFGERRWQKTRL